MVLARELGLRGGKDRVQLHGGTLAGIVRGVAFATATTPQGAMDGWTKGDAEGKATLGA